MQSQQGPHAKKGRMTTQKHSTHVVHYYARYIAILVLKHGEMRRREGQRAYLVWGRSNLSGCRELKVISKFKQEKTNVILKLYLYTLMGIDYTHEVQC